MFLARPGGIEVWNVSLPRGKPSKHSGPVARRAKNEAAERASTWQVWTLWPRTPGWVARSHKFDGRAPCASRSACVHLDIAIRNKSVRCLFPSPSSESSATAPQRVSATPGVADEEVSRSPDRQASVPVNDPHKSVVGESGGVPHEIDLPSQHKDPAQIAARSGVAISRDTSTADTNIRLWWMPTPRMTAS